MVEVIRDGWVGGTVTASGSATPLQAPTSSSPSRAGTDIRRRMRTGYCKAPVNRRLPVERPPEPVEPTAFVVEAPSGGATVEAVNRLEGPILTSLPRNDRKTIFGWAMYDWANSAFLVTLGAIISPFFADVIVPEEGWNGWSAETMWAAVVSIGSMVLLLLMPVLGAVADYNAAKRRFLRTSAMAGGMVVLVLPFVPDGAVPWFMLVVLMAHIGFVASNVFYDAFLPSLTTDDTVDRVSSKGFAYGYVGGGLYLVLALAMLQSSGDSGFTGLSGSGAARVVIFGAGLWWMGFTIFALRYLPETGEASPLPARYRHLRPWRAYAALGFGRTAATARKLLGYRQLLLFVLAYIFYNDGIQTVINISGSYAADTLDLGITTIALAFSHRAVRRLRRRPVLRRPGRPDRGAAGHPLVPRGLVPDIHRGLLPTGRAIAPVLPAGGGRRLGTGWSAGAEPQPVCDDDSRRGLGRVLRLLYGVLEVLGDLGTPGVQRRQPHHRLRPAGYPLHRGLLRDRRTPARPGECDRGPSCSK